MMTTTTRSRATPRRATRGTRVRARAAMRPYTVRKGDTVESIASKRSMKATDVRRLNTSLAGGGEPEAGSTILLPSMNLSARDREIIDGIKGVNAPRVYPVRAGESLEDIIGSRKIARADVERLNPKLGALKPGMKLLLPPGKYTVREREMLQGCGILPADSVNPLQYLWTPVARNFLGGAVALGAYAMYFAACRRYQNHGTKLWGNDLPEISQD